MRRFVIVLLTVLASAVPAAAEEPYPLDDIARTVEPRGKMKCPEIALEWHAGEAVKWHGKLRVNHAFAARLALFEQLVKEVGERVMGRAPTMMDHFGSFNCRRIRRYPDLLSEHGLGNAVDVAGFRFPALPRDQRAASPLPARLRRAVTVTVLDHWRDDGPRGEFLRALTDALVARPEIFRVMLGPAYPGHANHFHFDLAPYRLVQL